MDHFPPPLSPVSRPAIALPVSALPDAGIGRLALPPLLVAAAVGKILALAMWIFSPWPLGAAAVFFGLDLFVFYHLFVPGAQGLCRTFTHFATPRREIWLTIDDGPDEHDTPRILDLLERHHARATFFLIGERAARWPDLVAEILRRGHEVGHHTHTHPVGTFWCASPSRLDAEFDRALTALHSAGATPRWFRAPAGIKHLLLGRALARRGLECIGWTVRSGDCLAHHAEDVAASVLQRLRPGAIVLVHEGASVTQAVRVKAIDLLLEAFTARKFICIVPDRVQLR